MKPTPTKNELDALLSYDGGTGVFRWLSQPKFSAVPVGSIAGCLKQDGYVHITIDRRTYRAHQLAWVITYGSWPSAKIDHDDGDQSNNRIANLRLATHAQNMQNATIRRDNTSGFKGVSWMKSARKWSARIRANGEMHYLGLFSTAEEAYKAYRARALTLHGAFVPQEERTTRHG